MTQTSLFSRLSGALALAAALTLPLSGHADTLNPLADTYVQSGSTANNSAGVTLLVKNQNNQVNDRVTFLRFDGSGLTGGNALSASLYMTIASFSTPTAMTFQLFGIPDGASNEAFDATTLTFANSGYTDQSVDNNVNDTLFAGGAPLATAALASTDPVGTTLTFSSVALLGFLNANQNSTVTFVLTTSTLADSVFVGFASSENTTTANRPALSFTAAPVPEPATVGLAFAGGLGLLLACRRRA